jgi:hypothetical protein
MRSRWQRLLGIEASDTPRLRELGSVLALSTFGDFVIEGAVTSAFLARVGAASLPAALAVRAVTEVLVSLAFDRTLRNLPPRRSLAIATWLGVGLLPVCALYVERDLGVWLAFVLASVLARLKVIHFGVVALAELPGARSLRVLPLLHAGGRVGAMLAGPAVLLIGPALAARGLLLLGAAAYAGSAWLLRTRSREEPHSLPPSATFADPEIPPTSLGASRTLAGSAANRLLYATLVAAIALAVGRLALVTQSGAILANHYTEAELTHVLGIYFALANLFALSLQVMLVGRVLARGGLGSLNTGWSLSYLAAQILLAVAPPFVSIALGARMVESEFRNSVRTPVANLLYDALPPARRAFARTLVIGVAVPLASVAGGLALHLLGSHPTALSAFGVAAAVVMFGATWAQNRYFLAAKARG